MKLQLTPKQGAAVDRAVDWFLNSRRQSFNLSGYAGTGKTTLARHIANQLGVEVFFCAPTGKAAAVLARKGCEGASTLHRLIYKPSGSSDQQRIRQIIEDLKAEGDPTRRRELMIELKQLRSPAFVPNPKSALAIADPRQSLVILDESSMVNAKMGRDLMSFGVKVLALGDPAQLPPVTGDSFFNAKPDVLLDEIHRSEAGSPVTHFATQARTRGSVSGRVGSSGVRYAFASSIKTRSFRTFDQVIVGMNGTRHSVNARIREHLGRDPHRPVKYDRVMCLQNNYDFGILNGEQYHVLDVKDEGGHWLMTIQPQGTDDVLEVPAAKQTFFDEDIKPRGLGAFGWGYAITCHKAQGSQWPRVLILREKWRGDTPQWLYTAVTRASERVVVISPPR